MEELPAEARALLDAVVAIGSDLDINGVLRRIVDSACALTHAEYGVLATVDETGSFDDLVVHGVSDETAAQIGRAPVGEGLLGMVPRERRSVRLEHVGAHPVFAGLPEGHPPIDRFLGAPVLVGDQVFGHLYLGNGPGEDAFTERDQQLVEILARAAGAMIRNAREFEQSERHRAWMAGVARLTTVLSPSVPDSRSLDTMVDQVRQLSRARAVALADASSERLEAIACAGGPADELTLVVESAAEDVARAIAAGEMLEIHGDADHVLLVVPVRTELAAPAVLLLDEVTAGNALDGIERGLLAALAEHVGLTLDRAQALRERHELLLAKDRDRIARELHDLVIQRLFATGMLLQGARVHTKVAELHTRIDSAIAELDHAISDLRATIFELGRASGRSVHDEVRALVGDYEAVLGFRPTLRVSGQVDRSLTAEAADAMLLVLRESLSNMARHAHASSAVVELAASPAWVRMRVADDGKGFDPTRTRRRSGLDNARHRAEALGGHFSFDSAEGEGCRLEWAVPAIS